MRAGFALSEASKLAPDVVDAGLPDLVLLSAPLADGPFEEELVRLLEEPWRNVPTTVMLGGEDREGVARALAAGAADAMTSPIHLPELCTRISARLRTHRERFGRAAAGLIQTELFAAFEAIALAPRPEEALQILVQRLADSLGAAHCACIFVSEHGRGRAVVVAERPEVRSLEVSLEEYPELVRACAVDRTVFVPDASSHPLFGGYGIGTTRPAFAPAEPTSAAALPIRFHGRVFGVVVLRTVGAQPRLLSDHIAFAETLVAATSRLLEHEERRATIYRRQVTAAVVDPLTGCGGLDALDRRLEEELARSIRHGRRFSLVLLDLDGFQQLTQRLGVAGADQVLAEFGALLQRELRSPDFVARYGNDEFALLLSETDDLGAREVVARLRRAIAGHSFSNLGSAPGPAASAGVASFPAEGVENAEGLLALAESSLRQEKQVQGAGMRGQGAG